MSQNHQDQPSPYTPERREWAELSATLEGEVFTDTATRMCYATDASIYQQLPLAVVCPRHSADCVAVMEFCQRHSVPLIPRAAGTSLAGQCVGTGLVMDSTRHMNALLEVDAAARLARVQPGLILQTLNESLQPQGLCFPIDPSTANRCALGGMAGNNAWGAHSLRYGTTRDQIHAMLLLLDDGSEMRVAPLDAKELAEKRNLRTREGMIYRSLYDLVDRHRDEILQAYPDQTRIPSNMGYALDRLASGQPWAPGGPQFNLAPFLCGSEGTLAVITELTLKLSSMPGRRVMLCGQFCKMTLALDALTTVLEATPVALELLDRPVLEAADDHPQYRLDKSWITGDPEAVLLIELEDQDSLTAAGQARRLARQLTATGHCDTVSILDADQTTHAWALRRAGLGLLMGRPGAKKAVTAIEDCAVAPKDLSHFMQRARKILDRYVIPSVCYGSVGTGLIHLRPWLDLDEPADRTCMLILQSEMAKLMTEFGGAMSAKHGDGRLRAHTLEQMLGPKVYPLLHKVKSTFDPRNLLNPGKILNAPPPDQNLRSQKLNKQLKGGFNWGEHQNLMDAVGRCNGAGVCLQGPGRAVMCPSYMATRDERHTTRGRANVLRQVLENPAPLTALDSAVVQEAIDLCLACKGCKSECPAGVDMARIKADVLHQRHKQLGIPLRARLLATLPTLARWGSMAPFLANTELSTKLLRRCIGLDRQRPLPRLARHTLTDWWRHRSHFGTGKLGELVLMVDPFTCYFEPATGIAAVEFLEWAGYRVQRTACLSSGRTQISQGLLTEARRTLTHVFEQLHPIVAAGIPIIGLEPSELLTFRDEAPDLVEGKRLRQQARRLAEGSWLFEEWICREQQELKRIIPETDGDPPHILVHTHCHQKALSDPQTAVDCLRIIPGAEVEPIVAGCCGMAGAFGYEKEHAELSLVIAELSLLPAIRGAPPDSRIAATGFSCRQQIRTSVNRSVYHPAELLRAALPS